MILPLRRMLPRVSPRSLEGRGSDSSLPKANAEMMEFARSMPGFACRKSFWGNYRSAGVLDIGEVGRSG
jgi:hypothetical protein